jgi:thymidylate synthase (FAD)
MRVSFVSAAPTVYVVGASTPMVSALETYLESIDERWRTIAPDRAWDPEEIIEAAGRICYSSWNNPADKTRQQYIQSSIIEHAHGSVLEHVWLNLIVQDIPRSTQLELVRHGDGTAFSFESTRFTDKRLRFVIPPRMRGDEALEGRFKSHCLQAVELYKDFRDADAFAYEEGTLKRKRTKEMSRAILPNCLGSDGVVSVNGRSLRWIIQSRSDLHADLSIREFAFALYTATKEYLPSLFSDATVTESPDGVPVVSFAQPKV